MKKSIPVEQAVGVLLARRGAAVAVAESCTGGMVGAAITSVAGSSAYFSGGIIAYANEAKVRLLGVSRSSLARHGAVSRQVAAEMARGARRKLAADYGVAVTGIAGPGGGSARKPVGLVFIAVAEESGCIVRRFWFHGKRSAVRSAACAAALALLHDRLRKKGVCHG